MWFISKSDEVIGWSENNCNSRQCNKSVIVMPEIKREIVFVSFYFRIFY